MSSDVLRAKLAEAVRLESPALIVQVLVELVTTCDRLETRCAQLEQDMGYVVNATNANHQRLQRLERFNTLQE